MFALNIPSRLSDHLTVISETWYIYFNQMNTPLHSVSLIAFSLSLSLSLSLSRERERERERPAWLVSSATQSFGNWQSHVVSRLKTTSPKTKVIGILKLIHASDKPYTETCSWWWETIHWDLLMVVRNHTLRYNHGDDKPYTETWLCWSIHLTLRYAYGGDNWLWVVTNLKLR